MSGGRDPRLGNSEWADNWTVGPGLRMEIIDRSGRVWLCQEAVTKERARSLALPDGASPALLGGVVADAAFFGRSPGAATDGPLETMEVDGLRFAFVACAVKNEGRANERVENATVMSIDKHHTMLYVAGRTIEVLEFGDRTFATPAWASPRDAGDRGDVDLPSGWTLRTAALTDDLVAAIPNPAKVAIIADGSGFHGPLPISRLQEVSA